MTGGCEMAQPTAPASTGATHEAPSTTASTPLKNAPETPSLVASSLALFSAWPGTETSKRPNRFRPTSVMSTVMMTTKRGS